MFAIAGKLAAGFLLRKDGINRLAVGSGMIPRGEVGLIFAQIGLTTTVLSAEHFSILAMTIVITTVLGPLLLRHSLHPQPAAEGVASGRTRKK